MSREIKFRIWDDKKKEWLGGSDNDVLIYYGFHLVGEVMTVQSPPQWALDEGMVVEQYTGLKDENGKEVYEGDIVEFIAPGFDTETLGISYAEEERISAKVVFEYDRYVLEDKNGRLYDACYMEDGEVVGDIHENPEVLKGEE